MAKEPPGPAEKGSPDRARSDPEIAAYRAWQLAVPARRPVTAISYHHLPLRYRFPVQRMRFAQPGSLWLFILLAASIVARAPPPEDFLA